MNGSCPPTQEYLAIFERQKEEQPKLRAQSLSKRKKQLKSLLRTLIQTREACKEALYADLGRAGAESDVIEIYPAISELRNVLRKMKAWGRPMRVPTPLSYLGTSSYVQYEPKGLCLIITPWNYPLYLALSPIYYALAAGNAVIIKPSEFTPNTNAYLSNLLGQVYATTHVAVVEGGKDVAQELLALKFNHIHFTGSPRIGKIVMKAAAHHLATVTLELGGKSPAIVDESANISLAAERIAWGKGINAGQTCVAPDYLLVHASKQQELVEKIKNFFIERYDFSNERNGKAKYCNLINRGHYERLEELCRDAQSKGAILEYIGQNRKDTLQMPPVILSHVHPNMRIMEEEIFGPLLPIIPFHTIDEASAFINAKEKPLALYVFSSSSSNIRNIIQNTTSGGTCINDTTLHVGQHNLPFGGINHSGIGKSHGHWGFRDFSNEKSILRQHLKPSLARNFYPPYAEWTRRMIDIALKWL